MATLTNEQIEQKKQLLEEKKKEIEKDPKNYSGRGHLRRTRRGWCY